MASHKGIDDHRPLGLRDTVFHAIQGFPDRVSMSPDRRLARSASYRVNAVSRPLPPPSLNRTKEISGSFSSLSMKDTDTWNDDYSKLSSLSRRGIAKSVSHYENIDERGDISINSLRASSADSLVTVPTIIVTQAEVQPQRQITKAPAAKDVKGITKETMIEWVNSCRKGLVDKCQKMLDKQPELANYTPPYYYGYAAVHMATVGNWGKLVELLFQSGADLDAQTTTGNSALHLAAENNHRDMIRLLIRLGANPFLKDLQGQPYNFYLKDDEKSSTSDIILRNNNNKTFRPRPASQGAMDTSADCSFLRKNSFREAMIKFVRRSPSPVSRS